MFPSTHTPAILQLQLLCHIPQIHATLLSAQITSLTASVQRLERELKQERKAGRKLDTLKKQLADSKAEAQGLAGKLLEAQWELQQAAQGKVGGVGWGWSSE
jgi:hypothetical protein